MEAEMAFLNSMQAMNEAAGHYESNGVAGTDHTEALSTEDNQRVKVQSTTAYADNTGPVPQSLSLSDTLSPEVIHPVSAAHQLSAPLPGVKGSDTEHAFNAEEQNPSRSSSKDSISISQPPMKPRTVAGFVVDDEDEDDNNSDRTSSLAAPGFIDAPLPSTSGSVAVAPVRSISKSPSNNIAPAQNEFSSNVALENDSELQEDAAGQVAYSPPSPTELLSATHDSINQLPTAQEAPDQLATTAPPADTTRKPSVALPKTRLPHDRVGILEDRIKEDPRGDIDAWLGLISEHRKRSKYAEARSVYERFFKVFPMAVSIYCVLDSCSLPY